MEKQVTLPFAERRSLTWAGAAQANGNSGVSAGNGRYAVWSSPLFDLRPDLVTPAAPAGSTLGAVPIWSSGQLVVQVQFKAGIDNLRGINMTVWDEASAYEPGAVQIVTAEQDVTSQYTTAGDFHGPRPATSTQGIAGIGCFAPPSGPGGYVKYWRFNMIIRNYLQVTDPAVIVSAAFY